MNSGALEVGLEEQASQVILMCRCDSDVFTGDPLSPLASLCPGWVSQYLLSCGYGSNPTTGLAPGILAGSPGDFPKCAGLEAWCKPIF